MIYILKKKWSGYTKQSNQPQLSSVIMQGIYDVSKTNWTVSFLDGPYITELFYVKIIWIQE